MYQPKTQRIEFYVDRNGRCPVLDFYDELAQDASKDSRVRYEKFFNCIGLLGQFGTRLGEPHIKHIDGDIWELRLTVDRVLFAGWRNGSFVILHAFTKKTQKTPVREIEKAKKEFSDFKERCKTDA